MMTIAPPFKQSEARCSAEDLLLATWEQMLNLRIKVWFKIDEKGYDKSKFDSSSDDDVDSQKNCWASTTMSVEASSWHEKARLTSVEPQGPRV